MKNVKLLLLAFVLSITLSLWSTDIENASSSATVVPGEWNTNFSACKSYAEAHGTPLLILWSSEGCGFCNRMKTACNTSTFVTWRKDKKIVLVISENDASSKSFAKNSSGKFPYMRLYWPAGNVDVRFTGRSTMIPANGSTLEVQLINYLNSLLKNWTGTGSGGTQTGGDDPGVGEEEDDNPSTPVIGEEWKKARKINGAYCDGQGNVIGRVLVAAGKVDAKTGKAKVKLQIQNQLGKVKTIGTAKLDVNRKTLGTISSNYGSSSLVIQNSMLSGSVTIDKIMYMITNVKVGGTHTKGMYQFSLLGYPSTCQGYPVLNAESFLPLAQDFTSTGTKWAFARKATPRYNSRTGNFDISSMDNPSGLKLSYSSSTGYFKGSFIVYAVKGTRTLRKYTAKVGGYMVGNTGYGMAVINKVGSYPCSISVGD